VDKQDGSREQCHNPLCYMEPADRIELSTYWLRIRCSTY